MKWIEGKLYRNAKSGAIFEDPRGRLDGHILFYKGEIKDGMGKVAGERLFSYYVDLSVAVTPVDPSIVWDLAKPVGQYTGYIEDHERMQEKVLGKVVTSMAEYQTVLLDERRRQCEIKRKYGLKSLERLITDLDNSITDIEQQWWLKNKPERVLRNKREKKKKYEHAKSNLKEQIEKEQQLTISTPEFFGIIRIKPSRVADIPEDTVGSPESEKAGMEIAMMHEKNAGRNPVDVSKENLDFDIKSSDNEGKTRYIEVKTSYGIGDVVLTTNEWFRARMLKDDYYLYVVWNAGRSSSKLVAIKNPATSLSAEKKGHALYLIDQDQIKKMCS
ncbi:superfamily II DNA/RNA helicase, SNF2 family [Cenarchaeum symbiosum A]|uniref:Superfamily II DNA/RNA helicase, SNF2 family n=1 Tax=Cenarchaeum symbiosum (strain A) TaxID=414004 RepID=A0RTY2_CENSY|nr:superfamily II DNA/RNA helicase, SNF2 family [Cenarchaeum symbiosum A]